MLSDFKAIKLPIRKTFSDFLTERLDFCLDLVAFVSIFRKLYLNSGNF